MSEEVPAPLTVLVLDDREESRYLVATWLRRAGYEVVEARTGAQALSLLADAPIGIALLDVNLPDMSGFEVCEAIRADGRIGALPVIHLSATAVDSSDRTEGLLRGADAFLVEPLDPRVLLATITALVRRADMRHRAGITAKRLRELNRVTADVHAASSDRQLFIAVIEGASRLADTNAVLVLRRDGRSMSVVVDEGLPVVTDLATERLQAILQPALAGAMSVTAEIPEVAGAGLVGAAFVDETGEPAGAILVPATVEGAAEEIVPLLAQLAIAIALARANMRALDLEHRIAIELQHSLLPQAPAATDRLGIGFRYLAGSTEAEVGGDFYEAFALDDGRVGLAIGDVVGHSLHAATVMGELRHALRAYAIDGYGPLEVVQRLDALIRRFHPMMLTTLVYGEIDLDAQQLTFCNAGHLPPLIVHADGTDELVTEHGALLGIGGLAAPLVRVPFVTGDRLVLVTDGLLETRHESIDEGLRRLRAAADHGRGDDIEGAIDRLVREVGPTGSPGDDIAIVVVDRTGPATQGEAAPDQTGGAPRAKSAISAAWSDGRSAPRST